MANSFFQQAMRNYDDFDTIYKKNTAEELIELTFYNEMNDEDSLFEGIS